MFVCLFVCLFGIASPEMGLPGPFTYIIVWMYNYVHIISYVFAYNNVLHQTRTQIHLFDQIETFTYFNY